MNAKKAGADAPQAEAPMPPMSRFVNADIRWVVYRIASVRLRSGAPLSDLVASLDREPRPGFEVTADQQCLRRFAAVLDRRLGELASDGGETASGTGTEDEAGARPAGRPPGPVLAAALEAFGEISVPFFEAVMLDVGSAQLRPLIGAPALADGVPALHAKVSEVLSAAAQVLHENIDRPK